MKLEKILKDWEIKKLKDIADIISGGTPSRDNEVYWKNGEIPWATPTDITSNNSRFIKETEESITLKALNECSAKLLPKGSILMTSRATLGAAKINLVDMCTNQGFKSLVPKKNVDVMYLYYTMMLMKDDYAKYGTGTTFLEVNKKDTESFLILVPDKKEQQKIAQILSTVDEDIEKTEKVIEKYQKIKKGLMGDLLTGKIRIKDGSAYKETEFKEVEGIGKIPKDWEVLKLDKISKITMGQSPSSENYNEEGNGIYLVQGNADCKNRKTSPRIWTSEITKTCDIGDIIMTVRAPAGLIAKAKHYACIGRGVCAIKYRNNTDYLYYYLLNSENYWEKLAQGTTFTAISTIDIKEYRIVRSKDINEEKNIVQVLSKQDQLIEKEEQYLEKLRKLKAGLMEDLLTGKVRVKVEA